MFPVAFTTFVLYLLLRYLLRDKERLNNEDRTMLAEIDLELPKIDIDHPLRISSPLPNQSSDLEALAISAKGRAQAFWLPYERRIRVNTGSDGMVDIQTGAKTLQPGEVISALALDDEGAYCAAATSKGQLLIWSIKSPSQPLDILSPSSDPSARIVSLYNRQAGRDERLPPKAGSPRKSTAIFNTLHVDGSVTKWDCRQRAATVILLPSANIAKAAYVRSSTEGCATVLRVVDDGIQVWQAADLGNYHLTHPLSSETWLQENLAAQAMCDTKDRSLLALGSNRGTVEVWDLSTGQCIYTAALLQRPCRRLRAAALSTYRCSTCHLASNDGFALLASDSSTLAAVKISASNSSLDRCECRAFSPSLSPNPSRMGLGFGLSPTVSRRVPMVRQGSEEGANGNGNHSYPLSPHAMRRLSQVADRRKAEEALKHMPDVFDSTSIAYINGTMPIPENGSLHLHDLHQRETSEARSEISLPSVSPGLQSWTVTPLGSTRVDEKGTWDVCGSSFISLARSTDGGGKASSRWRAYTSELDTPTSHSDGAIVLRERRLDVDRAENAHDDTPLIKSGAGQLPFNRIRLGRVSRDGCFMVVAAGNSLLLLKPDQPAPVQKRNSSNHLR